MPVRNGNSLRLIMILIYTNFNIHFRYTTFDIPSGFYTRERRTACVLLECTISATGRIALGGCSSKVLRMLFECALLVAVRVGRERTLKAYLTLLNIRQASIGQISAG